MSENNKEKRLKFYPIPIALEKASSIIEQMRTTLCKIETKNGKGTGFFCRLLYQNNAFNALISNNRIINESILKENNAINVNVNEGRESKKIKLFKSKKIFIDRSNELTIIEIIPDIDKIYNFLELDEDISNKEKQLSNETVYIPNYSKMSSDHNVSVTFGILNQIEENKIKLFCNMGGGLSGAPILNLSRNKVIGIFQESDVFSLDKKYLFKNSFPECLDSRNKIQIEDEYNRDSANEFKELEIEEIRFGPESGESEEEMSESKPKDIRPIAELKKTMFGPENEDEESLEINSEKTDLSKVNNDKMLSDSKNDNMYQSGQNNFSPSNMIINNNYYSQTPSGQINSNNMLMNNNNNNTSNNSQNMNYLSNDKNAINSNNVNNNNFLNNNYASNNVNNLPDNNNININIISNNYISNNNAKGCNDVLSNNSQNFPKQSNNNIINNFSNNSQNNNMNQINNFSNFNLNDNFNQNNYSINNSNNNLNNNNNKNNFIDDNKGNSNNNNLDKGYQSINDIYANMKPFISNLNNNNSNTNLSSTLNNNLIDSNYASKNISNNNYNETNNKPNNVTNKSALNSNSANNNNKSNNLNNSSIFGSSINPLNPNSDNKEEYRNKNTKYSIDFDDNLNINEEVSKKLRNTGNFDDNKTIKKIVRSKSNMHFDKQILDSLDNKEIQNKFINNSNKNIKNNLNFNMNNFNNYDMNNLNNNFNDNKNNFNKNNFNNSFNNNLNNNINNINLNSFNNNNFNNNNLKNNLNNNNNNLNNNFNKNNLNNNNFNNINNNQMNLNIKISKEQNDIPKQFNSMFVTSKNNISNNLFPSNTAFIDLGNTSYLNSVLQLLGSFHDFIDFFMFSNNFYFFQNQNMKLSFLVSRLLMHLYPEKRDKREFYSPTNHLEYFNEKKINKNPCELFKFILKQLQDELKKLNVNDSQSYKLCGYDIKIMIDIFKKTNNSLILKLFNFFEIKESQCSGCNKKSSDFFNFNTIEVDLIQSFNYIKNSFNYLTVNNYLDYRKAIKQENKFCNNCRNNNIFLTSKYIYELPKILVFSLNRGEMDQNLLKIPFCVEERINLKDSTNIVKQYVLTGIVSVYMNKKKFVCCCRSPADFKWYYYEDEIFNSYGLNTIIQNHNNFNYIPCIMIYQAINNNI